MNFPNQIYLGRKKAYIQQVPNRLAVDIVLDCDVTGALVRIPMTLDQFMKFMSPNRPLMQNLFPEMASEVREMLISGSTPAEWQQMFGESAFTKEQLVKFGYEFDNE